MNSAEIEERIQEIEDLIDTLVHELNHSYQTAWLTVHGAQESATDTKSVGQLPGLTVHVKLGTHA